MRPESEYLPVYNAHKNLSGPERVHDPAIRFAVCLLYPVGAAFLLRGRPAGRLTPGRRNAAPSISDQTGEQRPPSGRLPDFPRLQQLSASAAERRKL